MAKWQYPLNYKTSAIMDQAKRAAEKYHHRYIGTEHILLGMLRTSCTAGDLLIRFKVEDEKVVDLIQRLIAPESEAGTSLKLSPKAEELLEDSLEIAQQMNEDRIGSDHMLLAMMRQWDTVAIRLLNTLEVEKNRLINEIAATMGSRGDMWKVEGEDDGERRTETLDRFSRDLTELAAEGKMDPVIGREKELQRLLQILSRRTKNNPCLIGEPGVGKTAIVEALAMRMASSRVPESLRGKRLVALDLSAMVAGTKYRGEFEERIQQVIHEVSQAGNILLFLDEIHTLIGAGGAEGALDAANILKPALSRGEVQLIGATTVDEYRKHIEKDAALERRFQPVLVEEPSEQETVEILRGLKGHYEKHHQLVIDDDALERAAALSARYIHDRFLPDKALDLIDEAAAHVRLKAVKESRHREDYELQLEALEHEKEEAIKDADFTRVSQIQEEQKTLQKQAGSARKKIRGHHVTGEDVASVVAEWTKIPVQKLAESDQTRLRNLEKVLHRRVIGQEEAVNAVSRAIRRSRIGLGNPARPIGSFLFLGPTGVGKTELSRALAEALFGQESSMIRIDMSEYMEKHSVSRMLGSPPGYVGYEEGGQLSERVRRNPYSVILFDEIEKAHPDVFNILLQILDEGHVTDSQGRKIDFRNTILIMTSNAGAERIQEPKKLGFAAVDDEQSNHERMKQNVMEEVRRTFRPEFLNRIDDTLVFHSLNRDHMKEIFKILWKQMNRNVNASQGLNLTINPAARDWMVEKGYDPKYGARPLRRAFQTYLEDPLADALLSGQIHAGDEVRVTLVGGALKFTPRAAKKTAE